jgi:branched-chain amino acid transport system substrate-binding protein
MKLRKIALFSAVVAVAAGLMVSGCKKKEEAKPAEAPRGAGDTIKIGFMGALTGDVAMFGKPTLEGMKMAVEEVNAAGGINGKKIEIVEADNRGDK